MLPVSYTHLDVYKRQVIGIAGIFRKKGYVGICCGTALAVALRFVCHFISGAIILSLIHI